jgi:hypothetical protein
MRAYLRSAGRIAAENNMRDLQAVIARAVSIMDREERR